MKRLLVLTGLLASLSACSFAPLRYSVPDVTLPGNSSGGRICYVEVREQAPANFTNATYRAMATYTSNAPLGSSDVTFRVYGRTTAPSDTCIDQSDDDIVLSDPITLSPDENKEIEVGGSSYGAAFSDLIVTEPAYWLGASLEGGAFLSTQERISLEDGVISVYF